MKKFAIAAVAALAATVSLASVAEAHRHFDNDWGRHGHWGHHDHWGHRHFDDFVVFRPDCSMVKIVKETDWGTKVVFVKRCD
jgi:hypothetical protein